MVNIYRVPKANKGPHTTWWLSKRWHEAKKNGIRKYTCLLRSIWFYLLCGHRSLCCWIIGPLLAFLRLLNKTTRMPAIILQNYKSRFENMLKINHSNKPIPSLESPHLHYQNHFLSLNLQTFPTKNKNHRFILMLWWLEEERMFLYRERKRGQKNKKTIMKDSSIKKKH